ncbi:hypothetical protein LWI29_017393 [Acer saccharum]|uniref:Uncharacterized protein n=1 Tax=Acer saccharum TaxID=4024 RepID=A0AA39TH60_ACESA|nr:hypothetical protein LWI29_017393 [Acer saccharum]
MLLRYERLLEHYFRCDCIGHVVRDCLEKMEGDGPEDFNTLFGPWLRTDNSMKRSQGRQQREDQGNISLEGSTVVHTVGRSPMNQGSDGRIMCKIVGDQPGKEKGIRLTCKNPRVDLEREAYIPYSSGTVVDERELHVEQGKEKILHGKRNVSNQTPFPLMPLPSKLHPAGVEKA